jgi:hypothetical protein
MKKFLFSITFLCLSFICFAQTYEDYSKYEVRYEPDRSVYFEFGVGAFIPNDDSNTFTGIDLEVGRYFNDYIGAGLNFKYSSESEWKDELNYIGPKFRYRVYYEPRSLFDIDLYAGIGYGWYRYKEYYDGYYEAAETMNYVVPNIGISTYINFGKNVALGFEPGFMWYCSTDLNKSQSVGVWTIQGKCKITF